MAKLNGHNGAVKAVCWISAEQITTKKKNTSKVLKFISASQDQSVIIWEWNQATNAVVKTEKCVGHTESVECLDVNQDKTKVKFNKNDKNIFHFSYVFYNLILVCQWLMG